MKKVFLSFLFLQSLLLLSGKAASPINAIYPGAILPDDRGIHVNAHGGGMLYYEGKYYWFGEHK
ncbi:Beta-glucanase, partial [termite gut metagenome]